MPTPVHVPQDITEEITRHLDHTTDKATLGACALTSRTFLYPSQQRLFYAARLTDCSRIDQLHLLCASNTAIPGFIQELHLPYPSFSDDDKIHVVLSLLKNVRSLILGSKGQWNWQFFSAQLKASLESLFKLPRLQAVTLNSITLPDPFPPALVQIPDLTLIYEKKAFPPPTHHQFIHGSHASSSVVNQAIRGPYRDVWDKWPISNVVGLHRLMIERRNVLKRDLVYIWGFSETFFRYISPDKRQEYTIRTGYFRDCTSITDFRAVTSLRRLSFTVPTMEARAWKTILEILLNPSVGHEIERLDIGYAVKGWHYRDDRRLQFGCADPAWGPLDIILSDTNICPQLKVFKFYVYPDSLVSQEDVSDMLKENLPLFISRCGTASAIYVYRFKHPDGHQDRFPGSEMLEAFN